MMLSQQAGSEGAGGRKGSSGTSGKNSEDISLQSPTTARQQNQQQNLQLELIARQLRGSEATKAALDQIIQRLCDLEAQRARQAAAAAAAQEAHDAQSRALAEQLGEARRAATNLAAEGAALRSEIHRLGAERDLRQSDAEALRLQLQAAEADVLRLRQTVEQQQIQLDVAKTAAAHFDTVSEQKNQQIIHFQELVSAHQREIESMKTDFAKKLEDVSKSDVLIQNQIQLKNQEILQLKNQLSENSTKFNDLIADQSRLQIESQKLQSQVSQLNDQIQRDKQTYQTLLTTKDEEKKELEQKINQITLEYQKQNTEAQNNEKKLQAQIQQLNKTLDEQNNTNDIRIQQKDKLVEQLNAQLSQKDETVSRAAARDRDTWKAWESLRDIAQSLKNEAERCEIRLLEKVNSLNRSLLQCATRCDGATTATQQGFRRGREAISELERQIRTYKAQLEEERQNTFRKVEQLESALQSCKASHREQCAGLNQIVAESQQQADSAKNQLLAATQDVQALQKTIQELTDQKIDLQLSLSNLEEQKLLQDAERAKDLEKAQLQQKQLFDRNMALQQQVTELQNKLTDANKEIIEKQQQSQKEILSLQQVVSSNQQKLIDAQKSAKDTFDQHVTQTKDEKAKLQLKIHQMNTQLQIKETRIKQLEDMQNSRQDQELQISQVNKEKQLLEQEIQRLTVSNQTNQILNIKALIYTKTRHKILLGECKALLEIINTDIKRNSADFLNEIGKRLVPLYSTMLKISLIFQPQQHPRMTSSFLIGAQK